MGNERIWVAAASAMALEDADPVLPVEVVLRLARRHVLTASAVTAVDESGRKGRAYFIDDSIVLKTHRPARLRARVVEEFETSLEKEAFFLSQLARDASIPAPEPLGFGIALTSTSVQTYINRRVPHGFQGRAFALQSSLKNGAAIVPLLTLGAAASAFGVESVLIAAPFVLLAVAYGLIQLSRYFGGQAPSFGIDVLASFWEEPAPEAFVKPQ